MIIVMETIQDLMASPLAIMRITGTNNLMVL